MVVCSKCTNCLLTDYSYECILCPQDPAVATSKRVGNAPYEAYDRGTAKNAWVTESDGKTPLLGEVSCIWVQERTGACTEMKQYT